MCVVFTLIFIIISIDIRMNLFKTEEHSSIATNLSHMASIYKASGQMDKALEMNQKVYSINYLACMCVFY